MAVLAVITNKQRIYDVYKKQYESANLSILILLHLMKLHLYIFKSHCVTFYGVAVSK